MIKRPTPYDKFEDETWQGFFRDLYAFLTLNVVVTLNFGNILSASIGTLTVTVRGAKSGDCVILGPPSTVEAGLVWSAVVSANDTVTIRLYNSTALAIDPASASWRVAVFKY